MSKIPLKVKWVKEKYDVEVMLDEPVEVFKTQLFALTGVPPERQKITAGAKKIEDNTDLNSLGLKPNQLLMLIGTADVLAAPADKHVFIEDLAPEEMQGLIAAGVPMGLQNLGNTCYMNSTLQVLNNAPDLVESVTKIQGGAQLDLQMNLTASARDLFKTMKTSLEPVTPFMFLNRLRQLYPQFDQRGEGGAHMQQDAEECLTQLMQVFNTKCKAPDGSNVIDKLFGIEMEVKLRCAESDAKEEEATDTEKLLKLSCHIEGSVPTGDGGNKGGTDLITQSISKGLETTLEKMSPSLGRLALYNKSYRIKKLPKFLLTQFVRFYWKQDTAKKAKILRQVKFPMVLDMKEYCTDEYQARIGKFRDQALKKQEADKEAKKRQKLGGAATKESSEPAKESEGAAAAGATEAAAGGAAAGSAESKEGDAMDVDLSGNEELWANYELTGVLTHQGRSADGGHYIAWIKKPSGVWYKFDDDKVSEVKEDEIKKLYGGGDWHMAYICLYQRTDKVMGTNSTRY